MELTLAGRWQTAFLTVIFLLTHGVRAGTGTNQTRETTAPHEEFQNQVRYLVEFGYLSPGSSRAAVPHSAGGISPVLTTAIRAFQTMAHIPVTGAMDNRTRTMMAKKRCGNKDLAKAPVVRRRKRYVIQGSKWRKTKLTWAMGRTTADIPTVIIEQVIRMAFQVWEPVTPLTFQYVPDGGRTAAGGGLPDPDEEADILVEFVMGDHGDGNPFDGPGGTLAHAFFPAYGGDVHLDDAERWVAPGRGSGINLMTVVAHEIGHSLGLEHSREKDALMNPFYGNFGNDVSLSSDDIDGIQQIYGVPPTSSTGKPSSPSAAAAATRRLTTLMPWTRLPTAATGPVSHPGHRLPTGATPAGPTLHYPVTSHGRTTTPGSLYCRRNCENAAIDAIVSLKNQIFVFQDMTLVTMDGYGVITKVGCITHQFPALVPPVDAAEVINGHLYIFKGHNVWKYNLDLSTYTIDQISTVFPGIPNDIDTVFRTDAKTYAIKGSVFYTVSEFQDATSSKKDISWWNIKGCKRVSTAMTWHYNNRLYFFCGNQYYRYHKWIKGVDTDAYPSYPRDNSYWWLGCQSEQPLQGMVENPGYGRVREDFENSSPHLAVNMAEAALSKLHKHYVTMVAVILVLLKYTP